MTGTGPDIDAFEALDFDPATFDHEAHVCVARELIVRYGEDEAFARYSRTLAALTQRLGVPEKYHETITRFYILAIAERLRRLPGADWQAFKAANADLLDGTLLMASYSPERLASPEARRHFLLPDRERAA
jgi:hypothetical protein